MRLPVLALLLATSTSALAVPPVPVFSADAVKAHVAFLADDLIEGREAGTRGHEIAARYVASQFALAGLQPAGDKDGWYQSVPLVERALADPAATVTIAGPGGSRSWRSGTAVVVAPSTSETHQDVSAPAVFVGFGLDAPEQGLNDYRGLDVRGKIVVALSGFPKGLNSEIGAHLSTEKARMAEAHGAVGLVTVRTLEGMAQSPWSIVLRYGALPRTDWAEPDGRPHVEAAGVRIGATLDSEAAEALFAGAPRPLAAVRAEADKAGGRPRGFALPSTLRIERNSRFRRYASPNVLGLLPGSDPTLKDEVVVLMAHSDHLGIKPVDKGDGIYNGALDNASGTAVMLEVARAFAAAPQRPRRSLLFVSVTAEEKGLLGSEYLAEHSPLKGQRIVAAVDLDMPILTYDFTDVIAFGADHSTLGESVAAAAREMGLTLSPDPMPEEGIFTRSDHYSLVRKGVPAVLFATGFANGGEKAWRHFLSTEYHQPSDDLSQPIRWNAGARFARLNYLVTRRLADADSAPRWYQGDFFGDAFAGAAPRAPRPARK